MAFAGRKGGRSLARSSPPQAAAAVLEPIAPAIAVGRIAGLVQVADIEIDLADFRVARLQCQARGFQLRGQFGAGRVAQDQGQVEVGAPRDGLAAGDAAVQVDAVHGPLERRPGQGSAQVVEQGAKGRLRFDAWRQGDEAIGHVHADSLATRRPRVDQPALRNSSALRPAAGSTSGTPADSPGVRRSAATAPRGRFPRGGSRGRWPGH